MSRGANAGGGVAGPGTPEPEQALDVRVLGGRPSDVELAAVTAVLHAAVAERAATPEPLLVADGHRWQRANGFLRATVVPGRGAWRSF